MASEEFASEFHISFTDCTETNEVPSCEAFEVLTRDEWAALIDEVSHYPTMIPKAQTFRRAWDSACRAVQVTCDDGVDYVVKGAQVGRSIFNEQVVGRLGVNMGAPVGEVGFIEIPEELIKGSREMSHMPSGLAHSSRYVPNCSNGSWFRYVDVKENRLRFSLLSVLFGWVVLKDYEFFFSDFKPNLVYSFDHEQSFPGGPNWKIEALCDGEGRVADLDDVVVQNCGLSSEEISVACSYLQNVKERDIALAIGSVPREWGNVSNEERLELASYLDDRCGYLRM